MLSATVGLNDEPQFLAYSGCMNEFTHNHSTSSGPIIEDVMRFCLFIMNKAVRQTVTGRLEKLSRIYLAKYVHFIP